jgi:hypothetical protein
MHSSIWGPYCWHMMHILTYNYPEQPNEINKNNIKEFFSSLQYIIPCSICRSHYKKKISKTPVSRVYSNKHSLIKWCVDLHNEVNRGLKKKTLSIENSNNIYINTKNNELLIDHYKLSLIMDIIINTCPDNIDNKKIIIGYIQFFNSLKYIYPCEECKILYNNALVKYPLININNCFDLKNWYNKIKYWQNNHKYNEQIYVFKYRLFDNKTKITSKLMFNTKTNNISKLDNTLIIQNGKSYNIKQNVILKNGTKMSFLIVENLFKNISLTDIKLTTLIDYNFKNTQNNVPKEFRT